MNFLTEWRNHSMGTKGRLYLEKSDPIWEKFYKNCEEYRLDSDSLLYRVHTGGSPEPILSDFSDRGDEQEEIYKEEHSFWISQNNPSCISWDNHWVSFTDSIDVIGSNYFNDKGLRGLVIVIKPKKAFKIYPFIKKSNVFGEREVVAPMDKSTCIEVLPFDDFISKYGKGTSDYERYKIIKHH